MGLKRRVLGQFLAFFGKNERGSFPSRKQVPATKPAGGGSDVCRVVAGLLFGIGAAAELTGLSTDSITDKRIGTDGWAEAGSAGVCGFRGSLYPLEAVMGDIAPTFSP
jgi:hypothetical protein